MNKYIIELENNRYLSNSTKEIKIINSSIGKEEVTNYLELENELEAIGDEIYKINNLLSDIRTNVELECYMENISSEIKGILSNLKRLKAKRNKHLILGTLSIAFLFCFWFDNWKEFGFEIFSNINSFISLLICLAVCSIITFTNFSKGLKDIREIRNEKRQVNTLNKKLAWRKTRKDSQHLELEYQEALHEKERLEDAKRNIKAKLHHDYMVVEEALLEEENIINYQVNTNPKVRKLKLEKNRGC